VPSGRCATASASRIARPSLIAIAWDNGRAEFRPVGRVQFPGHAPTVDRRSPVYGRQNPTQGLIYNKDDPAFCVGGVNRYRERIEPGALVGLAFTNHGQRKTDDILRLGCAVMVSFCMH
jgi:hypothetical protein